MLHPVSREGVDDTDFGTREFATLDLDETRHLLSLGLRMIRLGRISYVNMAPVFHRLAADVEVTYVPTDLNRRPRR